jgi:hypothetical protein
MTNTSPNTLLAFGQGDDRIAGTGHIGHPPLEEFYEVYCPPRFPKAKGRRAKQALAKKYALPTIRIGHATLICPRAGDDRLRSLARHLEPERRRGRPRS